MPQDATPNTVLPPFPKDLGQRRAAPTKSVETKLALRDSSDRTQEAGPVDLVVRVLQVHGPDAFFPSMIQMKVTQVTENMGATRMCGNVEKAWKRALVTRMWSSSRLCASVLGRNCRTSNSQILSKHPRCFG